MLTADNLKDSPENILEIVCKIGKGSYGHVYKAVNKETKKLMAIKQVPVDGDFQELIKEISIMQECNSPFIVQYYGSYFKDTDLWIVMEYCGGGSVSDVIKLRRKTLNEEEIQQILYFVLRGLQYLHLSKKIHRDIKAGNILLTMDGRAKLADFGVAGQLTDTMSKRNTVIGTPFWMAPEIIQEIGYDYAADIWSLGITCIEMAEGKPPYADIHPMRAIFKIPTRPPPTLQNSNEWSKEFGEFIENCLKKSAEERPSATDLLEMDFLSNFHETYDSLKLLIKESLTAREALLEAQQRHQQQQKEENSAEFLKFRESQLNLELDMELNDQQINDEQTTTTSSTSTLSSDCNTMIVNEEVETTTPVALLDGKMKIINLENDRKHSMMSPSDKTILNDLTISTLITNNQNNNNNNHEMLKDLRNRQNENIVNDDDDDDDDDSMNKMNTVIMLAAPGHTGRVPTLNFLPNNQSPINDHSKNQNYHRTSKKEEKIEDNLFILPNGHRVPPPPPGRIAQEARICQFVEKKDDETKKKNLVNESFDGQCVSLTSADSYELPPTILSTNHSSTSNSSGRTKSINDCLTNGNLLNGKINGQDLPEQLHFLEDLSDDELQIRLLLLKDEMVKELSLIEKHYENKRKPIQTAILMKEQEEQSQKLVHMKREKI
ncbi:hypothetical protein SNEBB_000088 [Seison nebaliae]|nr:hypothetical protein SNEBB_000088 [Seison nebaliae]